VRLMLVMTNEDIRMMKYDRAETWMKSCRHVFEDFGLPCGGYAGFIH